MYDMELNWAGRPPGNAPEMFMAHNQPWITDVDPGVTEERVNQSETYWTGDVEKNKNTKNKISVEQNVLIVPCLLLRKTDRDWQNEVHHMKMWQSSFENKMIIKSWYHIHDDQIMTIWRSSYEDRKKMNKEVLMCHLPQERPVSNGRERQWPPTRPRCIQL